MKHRLAVALLLLSSCTPGDPTPVAVAPSPSPTPVADTDPKSCKQQDLMLLVLNGAGNPDTFFDYREPVDSWARPVNKSGTVLTPGDCPNIPSTVGWSWTATMAIEQLGCKTCFRTQLRADDAGSMQIIATHGDFKTIYGIRLVRSLGDVVRLAKNGLVEEHYFRDVLVYRKEH